MKILREFIHRYEQIIIDYKYRNKRTYLMGHYVRNYAKAAGALIGLLGIVFLIGWLLSLLGNISFLLTAGTIVIIVTFMLSKVFSENAHKRAVDADYKIRTVIYVEGIYLLVTILSASILLQLTIYNQALSVVLLVLTALFFVLSLSTYTYMFLNTKEIDIPNPIRLVVNGVLFAVLFYAITVLIQIEHVAISMAVSLMIAFLFLLLRLYIVKYFVIKYSRYAVAGIGLFLILLSFPFNRAFNIMSLYRGEFSLRILYETFIEPVDTFDDSVQGDIVVYNDYIIIVDSEDITFYDQDLNVVNTIRNQYENVYTMDGKLLANMLANPTSNVVRVYEYEDDDFQALGNFLLNDPTDELILGDSQYLYSSDRIYEKVDGQLDYTVVSSTGTDDPVIYEKTNDFILFDYEIPYIGYQTSYKNDIRGNIYQKLMYHNNHMAFIYSQRFVISNQDKVAPEDDGKVLIYFVNATDYFSPTYDEVPPFFELPSLFQLNKFYYENNKYILVGHIRYSTGDYNNMMYIFDDNGNLENQIVFDGAESAVSDDYIIYQNEQIELYSFDAETTYQYTFLQGYGVTYFVIVLVAAFSMERIHLKPHLKIKRKKESIV